MTTQTIIKKKRVVAAAGHHGGAWKVAYADFVTAMMAFFLLMWLLNATTEDQRKGLADYFDPSIPVSPVSGGGKDALMGDDVLTTERMATNEPPAGPDDARSVDRALHAALDRAGADVSGERLRVTATPEGTLIELMEGRDAPMFGIGSAVPSGDLDALLSAVAEVIEAGGRPVKIAGHTDGHSYGDATYTNWELSADRANTARRMLLAAGVAPSAVVEVVGRADRVPVGVDVMAPANRRIAVTLLDDAPAVPARRKPTLR